MGKFHRMPRGGARAGRGARGRMRPLLAVLLALVLALVLALGALAPAAQAAGTTYYVATTGTNTGCAGTRANPIPTLAAALACATDGDTISIAAGTYTGGVTIAHSVTLRGADQTTLQGGVPVVTVDGVVAATIEDLTISGDNTGHQGGGIFNKAYSTLMVVDSTISGNYGDFGGGIDNLGALSVVGSTISGNQAGRGGGIWNQGTLTAANSTISGNQADESPGDGGGIYNVGTATLTNSTISGNSADYPGGGAGNLGGGIYNQGGQVTLNNTLLAGNAVAADGTGPDCDGSLADGPGGHNLIGDDSACVGLTDGVNGDRVGTHANPIDPKLGPLADNGGPTQTMALLPSSPAIGAGDAATCLAAPIDDVDQRGVPRNAALRGACDVGAYDTGGYTRVITAPIPGGLTLTSGSTLVSGTSVGGSVTVRPGASLTLLDTTVGGGVQATGGRALTVCGSTLGSLTASGTTGPVLVGSGGDAGDTACAGNTIKGAVTLSGNRGPVELGGNQIAGGVVVTHNTGTGSEAALGAPEIEGNRIGGSLGCSGNSPAPTNDGQPNTVTGARSGQCAGL